MRLITELFEEAESVNLKDQDSFMRDRENQKLREQWILGRFAENYNNQAHPKMIYAEHLHPPEPDFRISDNEQNWIFDAEITEALDADRKRDLELKSQSEGFEFVPEDNYFPVLEKRISDKCSKNYSQDTILIIYFNVFSSLYDSEEYFNLHFFSSLKIPQQCVLSQIWLLESGCSDILKLM